MSQTSAAPAYRLAVTAGLDYDHSTHQPVEVNGKTLRLEDDRATFDLNVRIQDYSGKSTSNYRARREQGKGKGEENKKKGAG